MKIDEDIRTIYAAQRRTADRLKREVDVEIKNVTLANWHYESRVKELESFALKVESSRTDTPDAVDDMFACVVVVPTFVHISDAVDQLQSLYGEESYRRPKSSTQTTKSPADFRFDDLRLYFHYVDKGFGPPSGLEGMIFEVQVRTFLQHAWTIATHDVIYKSQNVSWRRERVAHHAKAALEQAEVTIESIAALEHSQALPETNADFDMTNEIVRILGENWTKDQLPIDVRRLADAIKSILRSISLSTRDFQELLERGRSRYNGAHNADWSPYRASLQYIAEQNPVALKRVVCKAGKAKIFVYESVLRELQVEPSSAKGCTLIRTAT